MAPGEELGCRHHGRGSGEADASAEELDGHARAVAQARLAVALLLLAAPALLCSPGGGWFWALGGRGTCAQEMLCGLATGRARNAGELPKRVAMARATVLPG